MFSFVLDATIVVKIVILLLLFASMFSWTIIFQRWFFFKHAREAIKNFATRFWSGDDLGKYYQELHLRHEKLEGLEHIFHAGFREFSRLNKQAVANASAIMDGSQRAMRVAVAREADKLEKHLSFLATVGSTSPYVGLFGTVWGIMNAFRALGAVQQATIAMVAPGISEALVTTAMGLFAAIPAVIAYNRYANVAENIINNYDTFKEEFSSILHRQTHSQAQQMPQAAPQMHNLCQKKSVENQ
jgi:biopolymer transport protein TolQ